MKFIISLLVVSILFVSVNQVYGDHSEVTIVPVSECQNVEENCFTPNIAIVDVGGVVVFSNTDTIPHTFTSGSIETGPDSNFNTGLLGSGGSYEITLETFGNFPYFCNVHPWMTGLIIVESGDTRKNHIEKQHSIIEPNNENQKLKDQIKELTLENIQLKKEIKSLKEKIELLSEEFIDTIKQLKQWFMNNNNTKS